MSKRIIKIINRMNAITNQIEDQKAKNNDTYAMLISDIKRLSNQNRIDVQKVNEYALKFK